MALSAKMRALRLAFQRRNVLTSEVPISKIRHHFPEARLLHAAGWALSGNLIPMVVAVAAVPYLLRTLGVERMGVLSLVWVLVGYFNFLDLGLGRAVTVAIARVRSGPDADNRSEREIVGTVATLLTMVGLCAGGVLWVLTQIFGVPVVSPSSAFVAEVQRAVFWIVPSLPLLLLATVLRGHLEAIGAFRALNAVRIPTGVFLVLGPCLAVWHRADLEAVCASILLVRLVHTLALLHLSAKELHIPAHRILTVLLGSWNRRWLTPLLSFGGWVTVSNVLGPVIVYADRFVLGATVAAGAVAVYAIPFDVVSRLPVLTASLGAVLLPELVRLQGPSGLRGDADRLLQRAYQLSLLVLFPVLLGGWFAMPWLLSLWIDTDFAQQAGFAAQVLLLAFSINALSQIPFAALQSAGRVRALALLHAAELLPYLVLLWFAADAWGVVGAAYACLVRNGVDLAALVWLNRGTATAKIPRWVA